MDLVGTYLKECFTFGVLFVLYKMSDLRYLNSSEKK